MDARGPDRVDSATVEKPPHPQADRASNWAASWLPSPIEITDPVDQITIARIQQQVALGATDDSLDHLGEAASIHLLATAAAGRLISDDHGARAVARSQYRVRASSTVGVLTELLARGEVTPRLLTSTSTPFAPMVGWESSSAPTISYPATSAPGSDPASASNPTEPERAPPESPP